jgi:SAM-dependent methyltransferase
LSIAGNAGQLAYWNGPIGQVWAREQEKRDRDHAALTEAALTLAVPKPGEAVLDVGCGSGTTTFLLAGRVGAKGRAVGVDISRPMLGVARARAAKTRSSAEFIEADATDYPFVPQSFDLVFSQFGVMFFADPVGAFSNLHRALKPEGRVAFICWRHPYENPWAFIPESAAKPFLPPPAPSDPNAPGRYSFANPDRVKSVLLQAGFRAPGLEKSDASVFIGRTPKEAAASAIDSGPLMRTLAEVDEPTRAKVRAAVEERLAKEIGPDGIYLTQAAWLVRAIA